MLNAIPLWLSQLLMVLMLTLVLHYAVVWVNNTMLATSVTSRFWQAVAASIHLPSLVLVWLLSVGLMLEILDAQFGLLLIETILWLRTPLIITVLCWLVLRFNAKYFNLILEDTEKPRSAHYKALLELCRKSVAIVIVALGALLTMPKLGLDIDALLAFGGVGGIIMGLATRDILSSVFGGVMLHLDQMVIKGEHVCLPEKSIEGVVEHIGWRKTAIRTPHQSLIYIPNSMFENLILENAGRMAYRRFCKTFYLSPQAAPKVPQITKDIEAYLAGCKEVLNKSITVACTGFSVEALTIEIDALTRVLEPKAFAKLRQELLLDIYDLIDKQGAKLAVAKYLKYEQAE